MDWLKDKKNQPIIAVIAAVIIVAVFVFLLRPMIFGGGSSEDTAAQTSPDMTGQPTTDPNMTGQQGADPNMMGQPTASPSPDANTAAQPAQSDQVSSGATPMEAWRSDPFLPVGYKAPKKRVVRKLPIADFPFPPVLLPKTDIQKTEYQEVQQPVRRMAGLLLNKRVYAIIETNGSTEIVQPGQQLKDHLAVVEKIEQDKVILKTTDKKPRYIVVRMASSPKNDIGTGAVSGETGLIGGGAPQKQRGVRLPPTM